MDESTIVLLLVWLVLALAVGAFADKKGRTFIGWFLIAALLSPLLAFILVALLGQDLQGNAFQSCPFCAERIKIEAKVCRYCGRDLPHGDLLSELRS